MSLRDPQGGDTVPRDEFLPRVADILRRSGVDDAEQIIRTLELNLPLRILLNPAGPVLERIRAGRMIDAIKLYREITGVGLKEAKDACEALRDGKPWPGIEGLGQVAGQAASNTGAPSDPASDPEIVELVIAGNKIMAIKELRARTGFGLLEAKNAIEAVETQLRAQGRM